MGMEKLFAEYGDITINDTIRAKDEINNLKLYAETIEKRRNEIGEAINELSQNWVGENALDRDSILEGLRNSLNKIDNLVSLIRRYVPICEVYVDRAEKEL